MPSLEGALGGIAQQVGARTWSVDDDVAKVSLVGAGMKSQPGVAADMFDALAAEGINIEMISTSPIGSPASYGKPTRSGHCGSCTRDSGWTFRQR